MLTCNNAQKDSERCGRQEETMQPAGEVRESAAVRLRTVRLWVLNVDILLAAPCCQFNICINFKITYT